MISFICYRCAKALYNLDSMHVEELSKPGHYQFSHMLCPPVAVAVEQRSTFEDALRNLLNKYSMENGSDTPDYILAEYLFSCLKVFEKTIRSRNDWYNITKKETKLT